MKELKNLDRVYIGVKICGGTPTDTVTKHVPPPQDQLCVEGSSVTKEWCFITQWTGIGESDSEQGYERVRMAEKETS